MHVRLKECTYSPRRNSSLSHKANLQSRVGSPRKYTDYLTHALTTLVRGMCPSNWLQANLVFDIMISAITLILSSWGRGANVTP